MNNVEITTIIDDVHKTSDDIDLKREARKKRTREYARWYRKENSEKCAAVHKKWVEKNRMRDCENKKRYRERLKQKMTAKQIENTNELDQNDGKMNLNEHSDILSHHHESWNWDSS